MEVKTGKELKEVVNYQKIEKQLADDADKFMIQGQFTDVISDGKREKPNRTKD